MLLVTELLEAEPDLSFAGDRKFPAFQLSFPGLLREEGGEVVCVCFSWLMFCGKLF